MLKTAVTTQSCLLTHLAKWMRPCRMWDVMVRGLVRRGGGWLAGAAYIPLLDELAVNL